MTPQPNKTKNVWGLAISILFILLGVYITKAADNNFFVITGWACIGFFSVIALFSVVSLVKKSR